MMFAWIGRGTRSLFLLVRRLCIYVGVIVCVVCILVVGDGTYRALDSLPGRAFAVSAVASGKMGMMLLPWWVGGLGLALVAWMWWTHKIMMSVVVGIVTGLCVALLFLA